MAERKGLHCPCRYTGRSRNGIYGVNKRVWRNDSGSKSVIRFRKKEGNAPFYQDIPLLIIRSFFSGISRRNTSAYSLSKRLIMHPVNRIGKRRRQAVHKTSFFHAERIALRLLAMAGVAASNIHILRMTLIVAVVNAFTRLAVNGNRLARVV